MNIFVKHGKRIFMCLQDVDSCAYSLPGWFIRWSQWNLLTMSVRCPQTKTHRMGAKNVYFTHTHHAHSSQDVHRINPELLRSLFLLGRLAQKAHLVNYDPSVTNTRSNTHKDKVKARGKGTNCALIHVRKSQFSFSIDAAHKALYDFFPTPSRACLTSNYFITEYTSGQHESMIIYLSF